MERGIRLTLEGERPIAYIARDLGAHPEALRKRGRRAEAGPPHEAALLESSGVFAFAVRTVNYELRCRAI